MAIRMQANPLAAREARLERVNQIAATLSDEQAMSTVKIGRPHSGKRVVSIRLDPEVLSKFQATGRGWQQRMNDILKAAKV